MGVVVVVVGVVMTVLQYYGRLVVDLLSSHHGTIDFAYHSNIQRMARVEIRPVDLHIWYMLVLYDLDYCDHRYVGLHETGYEFLSLPRKIGHPLPHQWEM